MRPTLQAANTKGMQAIKCIFVGRLKERFFQNAAAFYEKRLGQYVKLDVREVKDGAGKLPPEQRSKQEGERIRSSLENKGARDYLICLDEKGEQYDSRGFAAMLSPLLEDGNRRACFVIGGPFGLAPEVRKAADRTVCLGRMTMPHELARVVLLEQLYRAVSIIRNSPYHND